MPIIIHIKFIMSNQHPSKLFIQQYEKTSNQSTEQKTPKTYNVNEASVYQLERFQKFKDAVTPMLTQQKRQAIQQKLQLQRIAYINTQQRLKNSKLFVKYSQNPFLQNDLNLLKQYTKTIDEGSDQKDNIVTAINELKNQPHATIIKPEYIDQRRQYEHISQVNQKIGQIVNKHEDKLQYNFQKQEKQLSFDDIVSIKQEVFTPIKQINIFQIKKLSKQEVGLQPVLTKHYIHLSLSSIQRSKYRIPFETHISSASRKSIFNHGRLRNLESSEIAAGESTVHLDAINFDNLISVSSGRLTPRSLYNSVFNTSTQENPQKLSEIEIDQIQYQPNTKNTSTFFQAGNFQREEIEQYLKQQLSQQQKNSFRKYTDISKRIKEQLQIRNQIIQTNINDTKLHKQLQTKIHKNIQYLYNLDQRKEQSIDKLIARNKMNKDRKTTFKNTIVINTLRQKKVYQEKIRKVIPDKAFK